MSGHKLTASRIEALQLHLHSEDENPPMRKSSQFLKRRKQLTDSVLHSVYVGKFLPDEGPPCPERQDEEIGYTSMIGG